jgi:hypothetical protein
MGEVTQEQATIITGPQIDLYRLKACHLALKFQARGMRMSRISPIPTARSLGAKGRTAKQLLASLEALYPDHLRRG